MRAGWRGPPPEPLPPLRIREGFRLAWRGIVLVLVTVVAIALFLFMRMLDAVGGRRGDRARAPAVQRHWARAMLALSGLRLDCAGEPMAAGGALVANHSSWLDIVVLMATVRARFVAKAEVRTWPVIGFIAQASGTVFVERRRAEARRQGEMLHQLLDAGERLVIFPEGTSTDGLRVLPFKSSLFEVFFTPELRQVLKVQPVTIVHRPAAHLPRSFHGWWGDAALVPSLANMLARSVAGRIVVIFHEPWPVAAFPDRKALAAQSEAVIRAELALHLGAAGADRRTRRMRPPVADDPAAGAGG